MKIKEEPKEEPKEEAGKKKGDKEEPEPGPEHPRFKKVYWEMSEAKRQAEDTRKDLDALRNQNRILMSKLEKIDKSKIDRPPVPVPDIMEDQSAWKAWHESEINNLKKEFAEELSRATGEATLNAIMFSEPKYQTMAGLADDAIASGNEELKNKIYSAPSPHRAAFEYGLSQRGGNMPPGEEEPGKPPAGVEGAGDLPPAPKKGFNKPTDAEARVIRLTLLNGNRNPSPEEWAAAVKKYQENQKAMGITPGGIQ